MTIPPPPPKKKKKRKKKNSNNNSNSTHVRARARARSRQTVQATDASSGSERSGRHAWLGCCYVYNSECAGVYMSEGMLTCVCVCVCVCARARARVYVCVRGDVMRERERERERFMWLRRNTTHSRKLQAICYDKKVEASAPTSTLVQVH